VPDEVVRACSRVPSVDRRSAGGKTRQTGQISSTIADGQVQGSIRKDLKADDLAAFPIDAYEGAILRMRVARSPRALKSFLKIVLSSIAV
jgi:TetR/AcrR family transcriptional repressor of nem operon